MLRARMGGVTTERWRAVERERGTLPPGWLEGLAVQAIELEVDALVGAAPAPGSRKWSGRAIEINVTLAHGTRVWDRYRSVSGGVHVGLPAWGSPISSPSTGSTLGRPHEPGSRRSVPAVAIGGHGRAENSGQPADVLDMGMAGDPSTWSATALGALAVAVDCFRKGMSEPIPFFPGLSFAVHRRTAGPKDWLDEIPVSGGGRSLRRVGSQGIFVRRGHEPPASARGSGRCRRPGRPDCRLLLRGHRRIDDRVDGCTVRRDSSRPE